MKETVSIKFMWRITLFGMTIDAWVVGSLGMNVSDSKRAVSLKSPTPHG